MGSINLSDANGNVTFEHFLKLVVVRSTGCGTYEWERNGLIIHEVQIYEIVSHEFHIQSFKSSHIMVTFLGLFKKCLALPSTFYLMYFHNICWLVRGSLFIELGCTRDLGKGWRGDLGTFMISRSI